MIFRRPIPLTFLIALPAAFLLAACGSQPAAGPDAKKKVQDLQRKEDRKQLPADAQQKRTVRSQFKPAKPASPDRPIEEAPKDRDLAKVDWGREITLEEIISMAKSGRIREIEWHVMPNVIRVVAPDGEIFHLKNENKGVDIRNTLINAGVKIGNGGVDFRHVF